MPEETKNTHEQAEMVLRRMLHEHNLTIEQLNSDPEFNEMFEALHQSYVLVDCDYDRNENYLRGVIDLPLHHIRERLKI